MVVTQNVLASGDGLWAVSYGNTTTSCLALQLSNSEILASGNKQTKLLRPTLPVLLQDSHKTT
jgi:hypothetical protein